MTTPLQQPSAIVAMRRTDPDKTADYWLIYGSDFVASSSDNPAHPQGVWGMNDVRWGEWANWDTTSGTEVGWGDLPLTLQKCLVSYFPEEESENL